MWSESSGSARSSPLVRPPLPPAMPYRAAPQVQGLSDPLFHPSRASADIQLRSRTLSRPLHLGHVRYFTTRISQASPSRQLPYLRRKLACVPGNSRSRSLSRPLFSSLPAYIAYIFPTVQLYCYKPLLIFRLSHFMMHYWCISYYSTHHCVRNTRHQILYDYVLYNFLSLCDFMFALYYVLSTLSHQYPPLQAVCTLLRPTHFLSHTYSYCNSLPAIPDCGFMYRAYYLPPCSLFSAYPYIPCSFIVLGCTLHSLPLISFADPGCR